VADAVHPNDPREVARYTVAEAARYVRANAETLRTWVRGRFYPLPEGRRRSSPVFASAAAVRLSFLNLTEAHVLSALRMTHRVPMGKVRLAVAWLAKRYGTEHPLLHPGLETDGLDLFVGELGRLVSASEQGQSVMREVIERHLRRIERARDGLPAVFYPFTRDPPGDQDQKFIVIDPAIAFGRPVVAGTRIPAAAVAERFFAGDKPETLAADYRLGLEAVYEAIRTRPEPLAA
jgi:uncharacterized protein (DUF433 family)